MPVVTVLSTSPTKIASSAAKEFLVRNSGQSTVYIGDNAGVSAGNYDLTLVPNASLNWGGDQELWGICYDGQSSSVEILYSGNTALTAAPTTVNIVSNQQTVTLLGLQFLDPTAFFYTSGHLEIPGVATCMLHVICNTGDPNSPNGPDTISQLQLQVDHWTDTFTPGTPGAPGSVQAITYAYDADTWWIFNPQYTDIVLSIWKNGHSAGTQDFGNIQIEMFVTDKYIPAAFSAVPAFVPDSRQTVPVVNLFPGLFGVFFNNGAAFSGGQYFNCPSVSGEVEVGAYDIYFSSATSPDSFTLEFWTFGNSSGFGQYNNFVTAKHIETFQYTAVAGTVQEFKGSGGRFLNRDNRLFAFLSTNNGGKFQLGTYFVLNYEGSGLSWAQ